MSVGAHLPPFPGTPFEETDMNTRAVFDDLRNAHKTTIHYYSHLTLAGIKDKAAR